MVRNAWRESDIIEATMDARIVRSTNKNSAMLLLSIFIFVLNQVDGNLVDPSQIGRELQMFARDALGIDEMQVKTKLKNLPCQVQSVSIYFIKLAPSSLT